ncbi:hypothetical protein OESDEN_13579 [Oesophagostomum dentatum]|uniref:Secreted protein n=1 Tax=Oesophagostomum dentatum TaxID=61180 RepID=A0A0B1SS28_OESDE|nr:hypothetical protein OESDEN_13579 [Oesophagostomum dentatum]
MNTFLVVTITVLCFAIKSAKPQFHRLRVTSMAARSQMDNGIPIGSFGAQSANQDSFVRRSSHSSQLPAQGEPQTQTFAAVSPQSPRRIHMTEDESRALIQRMTFPCLGAFST